MHSDMAKYCLENGVACFIEKPLGLTVADCLPLVETVGRRPVINMVGYCKRFSETYQKAGEVLRSGLIGEPVYLAATMYVSQVFVREKGWRYRKESSGGGVLATLATHLVDSLLWLFGDVKQVQAASRLYYSREVEDYIHSYLYFRSGLTGYLDASWSVRNHRMPEIKIELQTKNGMMIIGDDYLKVYSDKTAVWQNYYKQDLYQGVAIDLGGPEFTREDRYFADCVCQNQPPESDIRSALRVQQVIETIYRSAAAGSTLEVA